MAIDREQTPHPNRRRPTIPIAASRVPVHVVPFTPRTSPPPSATQTPPPTPLNLPPFTTSFDPLHMFASSSSGPAVSHQVPAKEAAPEEGPFFLGDLFKEPVDKGKGILGARPSATVSPIPKARNIRMVGRSSLWRRTPLHRRRILRAPRHRWRRHHRCRRQHRRQLRIWTRREIFLSTLLLDPRQTKVSTLRTLCLLMRKRKRA
ncbi:unnamed protein product [Urochloa humidicola]